ncbi:MAG: 50S ribosomal protein L35 [Microgenomates group bacterium]
MPKIKSKKALTNRLKFTKNGKVLRRQSFRRHLKASKSAKRLRNLKRQTVLVAHIAKKVKKYLGK